MKIEQAIGDPRYGDQRHRRFALGPQFFDVMRDAGATGRLMLSARRRAAMERCRRNARPSRMLSFTEPAAAGWATANLPAPPPSCPFRRRRVAVQNARQWRYIGKGVPCYDLEALCTGKAIFGMDAKLDGMVYASIEHPPVLGGKVKSYDDKARAAGRGVQSGYPCIDPFTPPHLFQPLGGVAVIADNTWAAFQGRKKLKIDWDNRRKRFLQLRPISQDTAKRPRASRAKWFATSATSTSRSPKGGKIIEAEYYAPHLAHASMEPPVAVAEYRDGKVMAWAPTQNPQAVQRHGRRRCWASSRKT